MPFAALPPGRAAFRAAAVTRSATLPEGDGGNSPALLAPSRPGPGARRGAGTSEPRASFNRLSSARDVVWVSDWVLAETYYALQHHYDVPKKVALEWLRRFAHSPGIQVSGTARETLALGGLESANPGFVDRLIHRAYLRGGRTGGRDLRAVRPEVAGHARPARGPAVVIERPGTETTGLSAPCGRGRAAA